MGPRVLCIIMERLAEISALTWCTAAVPRPFVCRIAVTAKIVSQLSARRTRKTPDRLPGPVVILADFACCEYLHASRSFGPAHLSGLDFWPAEVLVRAGMHCFAAVRPGNGRGDIPFGDISARRGSRTVVRGLRAALAAAHRRTLRQ